MHVACVRRGFRPAPGRSMWLFILDSPNKRFPPNERIKKLAQETLGTNRQGWFNFIDVYERGDLPALMLALRSGIHRWLIDQLAEKLGTEAITP